ncbi:MAG: CoB--CoM heterodisulfide reductase iron-sulfur subunit B family protein [Anaerolineae bacterium]|nr:CoB--CoM heterodisulfide reductase iron-sulfur subunit B family protein [Anaerolineae bacterium]
MSRAYAFYPGCTLHSTGVEYGVSARAVCRALGVELVEIEDWNCCGASSAHSLGGELADALPARNILLAQPQARDIAIPCAACYGRLSSADRRLREDEAFRRQMEEITGREYAGAARPRALLDILTSDFPPEELRAHLRRPLVGLQPVSYYGCLLLRPPQIAGGWDDTEHPVKLDRLLGLLGAEPRPWTYATDCCGASMTLNRGDIVARLVGRLVDAAEDAGANCIVTACPLCQANLDGRQGRRPQPMPVFYVTELLGLAMGLDEVVGLFGRHMVDPRPLLRRLGLLP